jgi:iron complex transport system ATP-binding protein
MNTAIKIDRLGYAYGPSPVLLDISVSVAQGEFFIIIGPNGSGKTTLLKLICGIEKPREGNIHIFNHSLGSYSRKSLARRIAMVPQLTTEDFPFRVSEIVLMGRSPHLGLLGVEDDADRQMAQKAMQFTGVAQLAGRKLNQLSGGERQRVSIARAICQQPDIILLDEPTAALDLAHQIKIMDLMEQLKNEDGYTVVMVSHDLNLAAMYADRILLLQEGRIAEMGLPGEVLTFEKLEAVYQCPVLVDRSPLGDYPLLVPIPGRCRDNDERD